MKKTVLLIRRKKDGRYYTGHHSQPGKPAWHKDPKRAYDYSSFPNALLYVGEEFVTVDI